MKQVWCMRFNSPPMVMRPAECAPPALFKTPLFVENIAVKLLNYQHDIYKSSIICVLLDLRGCCHLGFEVLLVRPDPSARYHPNQPAAAAKSSRTSYPQHYQDPRVVIRSNFVSSNIAIGFAEFAIPPKRLYWETKSVAGASGLLGHFCTKSPRWPRG